MSAPTFTNDSRLVASTDSACLLSDHFQNCIHASGRLHRLYCALEALNAFIAPRFVTTLVLVTTVLSAGMLLSR